MTISISEISYDDKVFINCPFDELYLPLFHAAIFATYFCGFYPTTSLAEDNGLENRIDKIARIIEQCRYGIHDISRTELNGEDWPRFNMPFELGLFYGARRYGTRNQKSKNVLILESIPYSYQKFLSDINGIDIRAHNNDPSKIIHHVRNWLNTNSKRKNLPGASIIWKLYQNFLCRLPSVLEEFGFPPSSQIPFPDICKIVENWLFKNLPQTPHSIQNDNLSITNKTNQH